MKISIIARGDELNYSRLELKKFLSEYTNAEITVSKASCDPSVYLYIDSNLPEHCYSLKGNGKILEISGGNASSVLCGVYEALADAGILFEATGYSLPLGKFDLDAMLSINKDVKPKCRLRGIRQHINFPMDISSYSLKEAKEYIRSIARMRFNAITFHSYERQWHVSNPSRKAGEFFYGQYHPVTTTDPLTASRIDNRKTFCIPEAEAIYNDLDARSEFAFYWLGEVMKTAKECCLKITMSVEPMRLSPERLGDMYRDVCRAYPDIDVLEIISYECGSEEAPDYEVNMDNIADFIRELFGEECVSSDSSVYGLDGKVHDQLISAALNVSRIIKSVECRDVWTAELDKVPEMRVGLYITSPDAVKAMNPILKKYIPENITFSVLPAHGSLAAANNIEYIGFADEDWQRTMIYSWAEFDGNMYIQQLSTDGIEKLTVMPEAESIYGICYNHWRTAENTITLSYAAETSITPVSTEAYYKIYCEKLGITDIETFIEVCNRLAEIDSFARDNLGNIGFCYVGCWFRKGTVVRPRSRYSVESLTHAIDEYTAIAEGYEKLLPSSTAREATALLRLLANRCRTSVLHVKSMLVLKEINQYYNYDDPAPISEEAYDKIIEIINKSRKYAQDFIHLYGEILPDRGGEGLIVSYCETTPVYIEAVASTFDKDAVVKQIDSSDAPPPPAIGDDADSPPPPAI